jgi:hypothetical protein
VPPTTSQRTTSTKRATKGCDVAFSILEYADHVEFWELNNQTLSHDHSLDECDANKRNSLLRALAGRDVVRGYAPAAVIGALRQSGDTATQLTLASAGGSYLTR